MADDKILHQDDVELVIDSEVALKLVSMLDAVSTHAAVADVPAASAAYVQAEANAAIDAVNAILAVLRDAGLIPSV